jgi:hypothetical protein
MDNNIDLKTNRDNVMKLINSAKDTMSPSQLQTIFDQLTEYVYHVYQLRDSAWQEHQDWLMKKKSEVGTTDPEEIKATRIKINDFQMEREDIAEEILTVNLIRAELFKLIYTAFVQSEAS